MKVKVQWKARFETEIEVDDNATEQDIMDAAADIDFDGIVACNKNRSRDVENTTYKEDTWEVEKIIDSENGITLM